MLKVMVGVIGETSGIAHAWRRQPLDDGTAT